MQHGAWETDEEDSSFSTRYHEVKHKDPGKTRQHGNTVSLLKVTSANSIETD